MQTTEVYSLLLLKFYYCFLLTNFNLTTIKLWMYENDNSILAKQLLFYSIIINNY